MALADDRSLDLSSIAVSRQKVRLCGGLALSRGLYPLAIPIAVFK
jgi:hypothetical protein